MTPADRKLFEDWQVFWAAHRGLYPEANAPTEAEFEQLLSAWKNRPAPLLFDPDKPRKPGRPKTCKTTVPEDERDDLLSE